MRNLEVRPFREAPSSERLLTLEEVCRKLGGVRPWTVRAWVSQRRIPFTKVGRLTRFPEGPINEWIRAHTVAPEPAAREPKDPFVRT